MSRDGVRGVNLHSRIAGTDYKDVRLDLGSLVGGEWSGESGRVFGKVDEPIEPSGEGPYFPCDRAVCLCDGEQLEHAATLGCGGLSGECEKTVQPDEGG